MPETWKHWHFHISFSISNFQQSPSFFILNSRPLLISVWFSIFFTFHWTFLQECCFISSYKNRQNKQTNKKKQKKKKRPTKTNRWKESDIEMVMFSVLYVVGFTCSIGFRVALFTSKYCKLRLTTFNDIFWAPFSYSSSSIVISSTNIPYPISNGNRYCQRSVKHFSTYILF